MDTFNTLLEAKVLIEHWRVHYNTVRPHSSLGYRPPAPEVIMLSTPMPARSSRTNRLTAAVSYHTALTFCPDHSVGAGQ